jgi:hypothetical protein
MVREAQTPRGDYSYKWDDDETLRVAEVWKTLESDVLKLKGSRNLNPLERQLVELFDIFGEEWRSLLVTNPTDEEIQFFPPEILVDEERAKEATLKYTTMIQQVTSRPKDEHKDNHMRNVWNVLQNDVETVKRKVSNEYVPRHGGVTLEEKALVILFNKYESEWKYALQNLQYEKYTELFPRPIEKAESSR